MGGGGIVEYEAAMKWCLARENRRNLEKILLQFHILHHESHKKSLGTNMLRDEKPAPNLLFSPLLDLLNVLFLSGFEIKTVYTDQFSFLPCTLSMNKLSSENPPK
jgi:hypothetical protein